MRTIIVHSMYRLVAIIALIFIGNQSFANSFSSYDFNVKVHSVVQNNPSTNSSAIDRYISAILLGYPMENEENEEEEEINEEEVRLKKVSVKDFYYHDQICCDSLRFLSDFDSENNLVILDYHADVKITACNYLLFQVFRL